MRTGVDVDTIASIRVIDTHRVRDPNISLAHKSNQKYVVGMKADICFYNRTKLSHEVAPKTGQSILFPHTA